MTKNTKLIRELEEIKNYEPMSLHDMTRHEIIEYLEWLNTDDMKALYQLSGV